MKKINKKLGLKAETVRALTARELTRIAGGAPKSNLGSGCLSCDCQTDDCPSVLPTACASQCWFC
jgi:hypothetical protein